VVRNTVEAWVLYEDGFDTRTHLLFLKDTLALSVNHCFAVPGKISSISLYAPPLSPGAQMYDACHFNVRKIPGKDACLIDFKKIVPQKRDITALLWDCEDTKNATEVARLSFSRRDDKTFIVLNRAQGIDLMSHPITTAMKYGTGIVATTCNDSWMAHKAPGENGDCGLPYVDLKSEKLLGFHVASKHGSGFFVHVRKSDLEAVGVVLAQSLVDPVYASNLTVKGKIKDVEKFVKPQVTTSTDEVEVASVIGREIGIKTQVQATAGSNSKIRPTIFQEFNKTPEGVIILPSIPDSAPAILRPVLRDGVYVDPLVKARIKNASTYQPSPPYQLAQKGDILYHFVNAINERQRNVPLRILTIEEAVFGCPQYNLKPIEKITSLGAQFSNAGIKREDFFNF
jgi:hypothetical protein